MNKLCLTTAVSICGWLLLLCQNVIGQNDSFFIKNRHVIDVRNNDDYATYRIFDSVALSHSLFFNGEIHFQKGGVELALKFFKYLHQRAGVRIYLLEASPSTAFFMNCYISSGNEKYLNYLHYEDHLELAKGLRDFYSKQDELGRFVVLGVDLEEKDNVKRLSACISEVLDTFYAIKNGMEDEIYLMKKYTNGSPFRISLKRKMYKSSQRVYELLTSEEEYFRVKLGTDLELFKELLLSYYYLYNKNIYSNNYMDIREEFMYKRIKRIILEHPDQKIFGQFGRDHIVESNKDKWSLRTDWYSFTARLNEDTTINHSINTILYFYPNFEAPTGFNSGILDKQGRDRISKLSTEPFVLFDINSKDSPYAGFKNDFDYVIVIK